MINDSLIPNLGRSALYYTLQKTRISTMRIVSPQRTRNACRRLRFQGARVAGTRWHPCLLLNASSTRVPELPPACGARLEVLQLIDVT